MKRLAIILFAALAVAGCKGTDSPPNTESQITDIRLEKSRNPFLQEDIQGVVEQDRAIAWFIIPYVCPITTLDPTITYSKGAKTLSPVGKINGNSATYISVISEDRNNPSITRYSVRALLLPEGEPRIDHFSFEYKEGETIINPTLDRGNANGIIDQETKKITVYLLYSGVGKRFTPSISYTGARVSPTGEVNFSSPVKFIVSTPDGRATEYTVTVNFVQ